MTIGNLVANKDVSTIVRAFSILDDSSRLTIVGDGIEKSPLKEMCTSLGVADRVNFTGILPPDAIKEQMATADIFVLSSLSEGRPNVVVEAMAAGCAVISSDLPGVRELIDHGVNGLLFKPRDWKTLSNPLTIDRDCRVTEQFWHKGKTTHIRTWINLGTEC